MHVRKNHGRTLFAYVSVCVCGQEGPEYPYLGSMADNSIITRGSIRALVSTVYICGIKVGFKTVYITQSAAKMQTCNVMLC